LQFGLQFGSQFGSQFGGQLEGGPQVVCAAAWSEKVPMTAGTA